MVIDTEKIAGAVKQNRVLGHWRSSALGCAVLVVAALQSIQFDVAGHLSMTAKDWNALAVGLLAAIVGAGAKDAQ